MVVLLQFGIGLVFGVGLLVSGMSNPAKVLNFLDLGGIAGGGSGAKRRRMASNSWCKARTSLSSLRAALRHLVWPIQAAVPPMSTPRIRSTKISANSGRVTA